MTPRTSRAEHTCWLCAEAIPVGERHVYDRSPPNFADLRTPPPEVRIHAVCMDFSALLPGEVGHNALRWRFDGYTHTLTLQERILCVSSGDTTDEWCFEIFRMEAGENVSVYEDCLTFTTAQAAKHAALSWFL